MSFSPIVKVVDFYPAILKEYRSIGMVAEFYVYDLQQERMVCRRVKLNRYVSRFRTKGERMRAAQAVVDEINKRLRGGWSPLHESEDGRLYTPLAVLKERFVCGKDGEGCRPATLVQYGSVLNLFLRWCEDNGYGNRCSGTFLRRDAVAYMDYCLELRNRHRSYNNTLKVMRAFFQWAVEHCYARKNPFAGLKMLKKEEKIRILVDADSRRRIGEYYAVVCPQMGVVCRMVYSSAIRPAEILRIRLRDVNLEGHYVFIPSENAKNHHARYASLSPRLVEMLKEVLSVYSDGNLFLIGKNDALLPDKEPIGKSYFQKSWARMRKALGLPVEMQLYSLRDTGLVDLLHSGVDQLTVRQHADHSSLAMQDIYTSHYDPELNKRIFEAGVDF